MIFRKALCSRGTPVYPPIRPSVNDQRLESWWVTYIANSRDFRAWKLGERVEGEAVDPDAHEDGDNHERDCGNGRNHGRDVIVDGKIGVDLDRHVDLSTEVFEEGVVVKLRHGGDGRVER